MKEIKTAGIGTLFVSEFEIDADCICFYNEDQDLLGKVDIDVIFETAEELGISEKAAYNRLVKSVSECSTEIEFGMITGIDL